MAPNFLATFITLIISPQLATESAGHFAAVRLEISGRCRAHRALVRDDDRLQAIADLRGLASDFADELWVEKIKFRTQSPLDVEALLRLKPTLLVLWDSGTPAGRKAELQRLHLRLYVTDEHRLDDIATTLLEFGKDPEGFVRVVAAEALGKMGPAAAPAVPALTTALMTDDVRLPIRAAAALGSIGAEAKAAIPALIEAMLARVKDEMTPYAESLGEIAESLASKGDSPSLPALKKALQAMELANLEPNILSPVRDAVNSLNAKADRP